MGIFIYEYCYNEFIYEYVHDWPQQQPSETFELVYVYSSIDDPDALLGHGKVPHL